MGADGGLGGEVLEGVFLDAGENGLFSAYEFETLTALGLMEYITPEEIAADVEREIVGQHLSEDDAGQLIDLLNQQNATNAVSATPSEHGQAG